MDMVHELDKQDHFGHTVTFTLIHVHIAHQPW